MLSLHNLAALSIGSQQAELAIASHPRHECPVMAAPVMVLELMHQQVAAAIDKAGGYRACTYSRTRDSFK